MAVIDQEKYHALCVQGVNCLSAVLIKGGRIITAVDDYVGDILIEGERIDAIGRSLDVADAQTYDATGLYVMPGVVDVHVHTQTSMGNGVETCDSFETGIRSAAFGSDADLVLFDPERQHTLSAETHHSNVDYSLFEGYEVQGKVEKVFLRGNLIVDGETWRGEAGMGTYQRRSASGRVI